MRIRYQTIVRTHKYNIHTGYNFTEFVLLLNTFLVISYARYRECMICLITFGKFLDVLSAFT